MDGFKHLPIRHPEDPSSLRDRVLLECIVAEQGPPALVTCTYTHSNAWSRAQNRDPLRGDFEFKIEDGRIQFLVNNYREPTDQGEARYSAVFGNWFGWLQLNHSGDIENMYEEGGTPWLTPEAMELFAQRTDEYVAFLEGNNG